MNIAGQTFIVVALVVAPASTHADSWPGPRTQRVFSSDDTHFVRIVPGSNLGKTVGFKGAGSGENARAQFYALQPDRSYRLVADVVLVNPIAPVDALVTTRGDLVTFDNWHNAGFGPVIAIYGPKGDLRASYTLEELYDEDRLSGIERSVSSRWWRCEPTGFVDPNAETQVFVREQLGGEFILDLSAPSFTYRAGKAECSSRAGPP